jgi:hypothetical protein
MHPSASSRRGSIVSALTSHNQIARRDDSRTVGTVPVAKESTRPGGIDREAPEVGAHAEALDPKWQSAIDAATD